jgi:hypothetical protein
MVNADDDERAEKKAGCYDVVAGNEKDSDLCGLLLAFYL